MMPERANGGAEPGAVGFRARFAVRLGRILRFSLRLLGRGATALPGKIALKIDPLLLDKLTAGRKVFLVTGTNGKTTTVRVLCTILREAGYQVITNPSGANMDSGLTTTLIGSYDLMRKKTTGSAPLALVFEIDEAYFARLAAVLNPVVCVVTNFFRDQLDRFGELQHTRDLIARGLAATRATAVLCADDSLCASLSRGYAHPSLFFGLDAKEMQEPDARQGQESAFCTFCGGRYQYEAQAYGHLGVFSCPQCGYARPRPDLCFRVREATPRSLTLSFTWQEETAAAELTIPGLHNAYNAAAALLAALAADLPLPAAARSLKRVEAAFGRMERFTAGQHQVCLILVKNPVGMDRALEFVEQAEDRGGVMMLLNAEIPDGRDVSWIWDVDFENHLLPGPLAISGVRCHDLALRLYYAGMPGEQLDVDPDSLALFDRCLQRCPPGRCLYIMPNYTAMLHLRAGLARRYQLPAFWRE